MTYCRLLLFIFIFYTAETFGQGLRGKDSFRSRSLYSFGISAGTGTSAYSMGYFQTYIQRVIAGTDMEKLNLIAVPDKTTKNTSLNEDVTFGVQLGFKLPMNNRVFQYIEIPVGLGLYRYNKWLTVLNNTQPRYPTVNSIEAVITTLAPSVGIAVHSRPVIKNLGFYTGVDAGILYGKYGKTDDVNNSINLHGQLGYSYSADAKIGLPAGIKYNASCDLNIELFYYPYIIFNTVSKPSENATLFQSFRLLLRYKLYQKPIDDGNKRTDMFF